MFQAGMLAVIYVLLGIIFIFLNATSAVTKIAENAVAGLVSLTSLAGNVKEFMSKPVEEEKDNDVATKFTEAIEDGIELSLGHTDEDDVRNAERTIETWNIKLHDLKLSYTAITLVGSFLLLVFIVLDFANLRGSSIPVNVTLIGLGVIFLVYVLISYFHLKRYTFTTEGEKELERMLNGVKIYIARDCNSSELENLIEELKQKPEIKQKSENKQESENLIDKIKQILYKKDKIKKLKEMKNMEKRVEKEEDEMEKENKKNKSYTTVREKLSKALDELKKKESSKTDTKSKSDILLQETKEALKKLEVKPESIPRKYMHDKLTKFDELIKESETKTYTDTIKTLEKLIKELSLKELVQLFQSKGNDTDSLLSLSYELAIDKDISSSFIDLCYEASKGNEGEKPKEIYYVIEECHVILLNDIGNEDTIGKSLKKMKKKNYQLTQSANIYYMIR